MSYSLNIARCRGRLQARERRTNGGLTRCCLSLPLETDSRLGDTRLPLRIAARRIQLWPFQNYLSFRGNYLSFGGRPPRGLPPGRRSEESVFLVQKQIPRYARNDISWH